MIEKVRLKAQIIWYFPSIVNVVKITRPLRSYRTPNGVPTRDTCLSDVKALLSCQTVHVPDRTSHCDRETRTERCSVSSIRFELLV